MHTRAKSNLYILPLSELKSASIQKTYIKVGKRGTDVCKKGALFTDYLIYLGKIRSFLAILHDSLNYAFIR